MANLKKEFEKQTHFNVLVNGKIKKVLASNFRRESAKYIKEGYGRYFDIPEKEANEMAAKGVQDKKEKQLKEETRLANLKQTAEKAAEDLVVMSKEVKALDKKLTATQNLADKEQKKAADLTLKNQKLQNELEELKQKLAKDSAHAKDDAPNKVEETANPEKK